MRLQNRSQMGFSLIETILGTLVLGLSVVGSFEALRLTDLKARHARIDNRITELLREQCDYVLYVAYDLLPADGAILSQGNLYQLYDSTSGNWKSFYDYTITANVQTLSEGTPSEIRNITLNLTYQIDGDSPGVPLKAQTIFSDAISRHKS
jgi:hypothetical protein